MKNLVLMFSLCALTFASTVVRAEPQEVVHSFKKGQAIDFLFLDQKPETRELLKEYFATVFPIALEAGYQPLPGFGISQSPTQGNYHPNHLALAAWKDTASRQAAMQAIEAQVPGFHQWRRDIWSSFNMTVYEMQNDVSFTVSSEKTYMLTAYWQEDDAAFGSFKQSWLKKAKQAGGHVLVELENGMSPFGYHYNPDYMVIVEWATPEASEKFHRQNLAMDHGSVQHVNQFILDLVPAKK